MTTTNKTLSASKINAIIASARAKAAKSKNPCAFTHALEQACKGLTMDQKLDVVMAAAGL